MSPRKTSLSARLAEARARRPEITAENWREQSGRYDAENEITDPSGRWKQKPDPNTLVAIGIADKEKLHIAYQSQGETARREQRRRTGGPKKGFQRRDK